MKLRVIGLIGTLTLGLLTAPFPARAQQAGKVYRIGILTNAVRRGSGHVLFVQALHELGYPEGQNLDIEWRFAKGKPDRLPGLARELVALKVDVLVTSTRAAKEATHTIPIVMSDASDDPVRRGLVASLAHPGGNITGFIDASEQLNGKRLQLLKEVVPNLSRVAILWSTDSPAGIAHFKTAQTAARVLHLQLQSLEVQRPGDLEPAFRAAHAGRAEAIYMVMFGGMFRSHQVEVLQLAAKTRLPAIYTNPRFVRAGGLMSYSHNRTEQYRRVAHVVDKILKGADPGDLPVERPTKFELAVNLKTAKQLGITIPPSILYRANTVIK